MERDLISEVLGYVDDYGSEVDTILPTFNVQNEREEIFDEYMRCLTFIEFMTLNKSNNNLKDEKYGICNIRPKDKISKMLINPETKYYYLLSDYNEITAEEAYVKHIESLKNSCRFLVFELQRENIIQEINNREVKNALNVLYKQIKSKSLNEDDRDKLLGDLKKCYQFFVSQCKPKLLKSYEGVLIMAERDTSDSMKSTYPIIHTYVTNAIVTKKNNSKMWDAYIKLQTLPASSSSSSSTVENVRTEGLVDFFNRRTNVAEPLTMETDVRAIQGNVRSFDGDGNHAD